MPIWLKIDPHSGIPIYLQLVDSIKRAIDLGLLQAGDPMPTVRHLSAELRIAPNTISKAYSELQRAGLLETRAGAGTVVTGYASSEDQTRVDAALTELEETIVRLYRLGLGKTELLDFVQRIFEQVQTEDVRYKA